MKLEFTNGSLQSIAEYLPKLKLNGRNNRARQKLLKKVAEKFQEFYSDIQEIKSDYPEDNEKQNEAFAELSAEKSIVDMGEYESLMNTLYDALLDYPHEIDTAQEYGKPSDTAIHDHIIDVLEDGNKETQNKSEIMEVVE